MSETNHYEEAERCLLAADQEPEQATHWLLAAQAHGTLALVEAQRITAEQIANSNAIALSEEIEEMPWDPEEHTVTVEEIEEGTYSLECETCGPIDTVDNLAIAHSRANQHQMGGDAK